MVTTISGEKMIEEDENGFLETPTPEDMMGSGMFGNKNEGLSHDALIMMAYAKCITALSKEMKDGVSEMIVMPNGNKKMLSAEDTRQTAIESVKTLKNVTIADLAGTNEEKKINELIKKIKESDDKHLNNEKIWWNRLSIVERRSRQSRGEEHIDGYFSTRFQFYGQSILDKIELYRQVFEEIERGLASRHYNKKKRAGGTLSE
jgi:hypothetical protein